MILGCLRKGRSRSAWQRSIQAGFSKIGTCQVVVSAPSLADDPASSPPFHFPVSARLYLPESWIRDEERRKRTPVPSQISQQTKPEIALALLDRTQAWEMPIQAVVVDVGYGDHPHLLPGRQERRVPSLCAVESTFGVRLPQEVQTAAKEVPAYGGRGQPRKPRPAPLYSVKELIEALPESAWQTLSWSLTFSHNSQVESKSRESRAARWTPSSNA
jgi:SRSO17 transposase